MTNKDLAKALKAARSPEQRGIVWEMARSPEGARRPGPGERTSWNRLCGRLASIGFKVVSIRGDRYGIEQ